MEEGNFFVGSGQFGSKSLAFFFFGVLLDQEPVMSQEKSGGSQKGIFRPSRLAQQFLAQNLGIFPESMPEESTFEEPAGGQSGS
jgi:hypothetical protein